MDVGLVTSHDSDNYRIRYLGFIRETLDDEVAPDESVPLLTTKYQVRRRRRKKRQLSESMQE